MGRNKNKRYQKRTPTDTTSENASSCVTNTNSNSGDSDALSTILCSQNNGISNNNYATSNIVFERYNPKSERFKGREYYLNSLCQVCKEDLKDRVVCPKCQFIVYCSQEHRLIHWPTHADLCEAVREVCEERKVDHIMRGALDLSPDTFRMFRFQNMTDCEIKVQRPLDKWEKEMFIFPHVCGKCHEFDTGRIVICSRCRHLGFCKEHRMLIHDDHCEHVLRFKRIIQDQAKSGIVSPAIPNCKICTDIPAIQDIESVFQNIRSVINEFEFLELTEITTYPLTALSVLLKHKDRLLSTRHLILHVVGAEADFETNKIEKWESYLLHLIPQIQSLRIEFIGPELNPNNELLSNNKCRQCKSKKKVASYKFHKALYHTFCDSKSASKPDLICVFNPGLYRATGFNGQDTWGPSIASMFAHNCPVLVTAYTHKEILLDVRTVKSYLNVRLLVEPEKNSFSSLKPNLNFVSDEEIPIIFKNNFHCVMCPA